MPDQQTASNLGGVSNSEAIEWAARVLGVRADDLGAIILKESGGDPHIWGGAGGNYAGVIQFGPNERRAYGWEAGMSFAEQVMGPMVRYFVDRFAGVGRSTQGASLLDLYRTVLGGNPDADINGADAFGTTPANAIDGLKELRDVAKRKFGLGSSADVVADAGGAGAAEGVRRGRPENGSSQRYAGLYKGRQGVGHHHHARPAMPPDFESEGSAHGGLTGLPINAPAFAVLSAHSVDVSDWARRVGDYLNRLTDKQSLLGPNVALGGEWRPMMILGGDGHPFDRYPAGHFALCQADGPNHPPSA